MLSMLAVESFIKRKSPVLSYGAFFIETDYSLERVMWSTRIVPCFGFELISSKTITNSFKADQSWIRRNFSKGIEIFCHVSVIPLTIYGEGRLFMSFTSSLMRLV